MLPAWFRFPLATRRRLARRSSGRSLPAAVQLLETRQLPSAYSVSATTYEAIDLEPGQSGVTTVLDGILDGQNYVDLGSNTFTFYGTTYTGASSLQVTPHGLIGFGTDVDGGEIVQLRQRGLQRQQFRLVVRVARLPGHQVLEQAGAELVAFETRLAQAVAFAAGPGQGDVGAALGAVHGHPVERAHGVEVAAFGQHAVDGGLAVFVGRVVEALDRKGYVNRTVHPGDARAVRLTATVRGRNLHATIQRELLEEERAIIESLPVDVRRATVDVVRELAKVASQRIGRESACCDTGACNS